MAVRAAGTVSGHVCLRVMPRTSVSVFLCDSSPLSVAKTLVEKEWGWVLEERRFVSSGEGMDFSLNKYSSVPLAAL